MYWRAAIVKWRINGNRVAILLFSSKTSKDPVFAILGCLDGNGLKKKWTKPLKIKRWLLYNPLSCSFATHYYGKTYNRAFEIRYLGDRTLLYCFDKDIIVKKFPVMAREIEK